MLATASKTITTNFYYGKREEACAAVLASSGILRSRCGQVIGQTRHFDENSGCVARQDAVLWEADGTQRLLATKIQLTSASAITECGPIAAYAFHRDEPPQKCWDFSSDETTGEEIYDTSLTCRPVRAFLLTPID
jgi:hypothetical protein